MLILICIYTLSQRIKLNDFPAGIQTFFPEFPRVNKNANILLTASPLLLNYVGILYTNIVYLRLFMCWLRINLPPNTLFYLSIHFLVLGAFIKPIWLCEFLYLLCARTVTIATVTFPKRRKIWRKFSFFSLDTFLFFRVCTEKYTYTYKNGKKRISLFVHITKMYGGIMLGWIRVRNAHII